MGIITSDTFNPIRAYANVRLQQGVPLVDADVNELDDIRKFDLRAFLKWFAGNGLRIGGDGFHILQAPTASATDILISAGVTNNNATTTLSNTNGTYPQPLSGASVAVPVATPGAFTAHVNQYVAVVQANGLFAGLYQIQSVGASTVTLLWPSNTPGVATGTTVTKGAKVFLAASDVKTTALNDVGRILVDGLEVIIPSDKLYSEQLIAGADVGVVPALPTAIPAGTNVLVFLDVWERNVSTLEDPSLIVQPLNTESCVRTKRLWVVRVRSGSTPQVLPVQNNGVGDWAAGHLYYPLASITRANPSDPITSATITDLREYGTLVSTIQQPPLNANGGKVLILDSNASGLTSTHLRIYADGDSVWFILNASWNGSAWVPDSSGNYTGGFRISRHDFALFNNDFGSSSFTSFTRSWTLPMTAGVNSAFQLGGSVEEIGRVALEFQNTGSGTLSSTGGNSVTFRNRFPAKPSSITFSKLDSANFPSAGGGDTLPNVWVPDGDGFAVYAHEILVAGDRAYWYGSYNAIA